MNTRLRGYAYAGLLVLLPVTGLTHDRWESSAFNTDDDDGTPNELVHGSVQRVHDLEGLADEDWMVLRSKARHSYEARVGSGTAMWATLPFLANFDRVTASGVVLTPGLADGANVSVATTLSVRWIAAGSANEFLRAVGHDANLSANDTYDVELYDTTYFMPRFNNSASQITILVVQNTTDSNVAGDIHFYDSGGALLSTQPLGLGPQALLVLNSATIPALVGASGSVTIAHLGGWGALAGKGVSLEPTTGFTFDTPLTTLPR